MRVTPYRGGLTGSFAVSLFLGLAGVFAASPAFARTAAPIDSAASTRPTVQRAKPPRSLEVAVGSTAGVWVIAYEHQPYDAKLRDYDYNKLHERTSKIGMTIDPQMMLTWGAYSAAAEIQVGSHDYRGGGSSSLRSAKLEVGWSPGTGRGVTGRFLLGYEWFRADVDHMNTLLVDHTADDFGWGFMIGSVPEGAFVGDGAA